jgi:hypothetical protein
LRSQSGGGGVGLSRQGPAKQSFFMPTLARVGDHSKTYRPPLRVRRPLRNSVHAALRLSRTREGLSETSRGYGVASPVWRGYVGFGIRVGQKQSLFHATPVRRVLEKVPGTSLAHAQRPFGKPPGELPRAAAARARVRDCRKRAKEMCKKAPCPAGFSRR